jgi:small subunit ribosomal protein S6
MRAYELGVIVSGEVEEPAAQAWMKTVSAQVVAAGGQVVGNPEWWGRRRFAYEIAHRWEGYYFFLNVVAQGGALDGLERSLRLADDIVRHKLIRLPDAEARKRNMGAAADAAA